MMIITVCWDWRDNNGSTETEKILFYGLTLENSLTSNYWVYSDVHSKNIMYGFNRYIKRVKPPIFFTEYLAILLKIVPLMRTRFLFKDQLYTHCVLYDQAALLILFNSKGN